MITKSARPKFLNLFKIHLPVAGINSIAHRISGALMFVSLPFCIYLFSLSLKDGRGFEAARHWLDTPLVKLAFLVLLWSFLHHLLAGIRFLLIDVNIGMDLASARRTAWLANLGAVLLFALITMRVW